MGLAVLPYGHSQRAFPLVSGLFGDPDGSDVVDAGAQLDPTHATFGDRPPADWAGRLGRMALAPPAGTYSVADLGTSSLPVGVPQPDAADDVAAGLLDHSQMEALAVQPH